MTKETDNEELDTGPADHELVELAQKGDTEAFGILIDRYQERIFKLTYHMTGNREEAEDLAQDAFVRAFKALDRFKGKSSFYTWLYRISVNRTLNELKKLKKRRSLSFDDEDILLEKDPAIALISSKNSPFRGVTLNELQKKLNEALLTLSEKHRIVVVMHDINGIPHDEIAEVVGCSSGTVRSRLFYARQQLQAELAEYSP